MSANVKKSSEIAPRRREIGKKEVLGALLLSNARVTKAAEMLNVNYRTLMKDIKRHGIDVKALQHAAREAIIDSAEQKLAEKIESGSLNACLFALRSEQGRVRGWGEYKSGFTAVSNQESITIVFEEVGQNRCASEVPEPTVIDIPSIEPERALTLSPEANLETDEQGEPLKSRDGEDVSEFEK